MAWVRRRAILIGLICFGGAFLPVIPHELSSRLLPIPFFWGMIAMGRVFYDLFKRNLKCDHSKFGNGWIFINNSHIGSINKSLKKIKHKDLSG